MQIKQVRAREILDSRGNPTVEAEIQLITGEIATASVPSGASTGKNEAAEIRDNDSRRYLGRGVLNAVAHINGVIADCLQGADVMNQQAIDARLCELDGTENKSRLGANAILAVSLATARARSLVKKLPLFQCLMSDTSMSMPVPMMNVLNGGAHADNNVDIQEFMIMPVGAATFPDALQMGTEIFHCLKSVLKQQGLNTAVGDEGGFAPNLRSNRQALDMLVEAVHGAGFQLQKDIVFALDVAASELWEEDGYHLYSESKQLSSLEMVRYYEDLIANYPIVSIEDGLDESDWDGWHALTESLGNQIQLVGDDLFVTNQRILQKGIDKQIANAILIKLNQIGTLTETIEAIQLAQANRYNCILSHRSGETEDTFIADLAVASGCGQIKTGSLCRTDRIAKYNQLLRIQEWCNLDYAGKWLFQNK